MPLLCFTALSPGCVFWLIAMKSHPVQARLMKRKSLHLSPKDLWGIRAQWQQLMGKLVFVFIGHKAAPHFNFWHYVAPISDVTAGVYATFTVASCGMEGSNGKERKKCFHYWVVDNSNSSVIRVCLSYRIVSQLPVYHWQTNPFWICCT